MINLNTSFNNDELITLNQIFLWFDGSRLLNTVPLAFVVILVFLVSKHYEGFYSINFMLFFIYSWKFNFTGMQVFSVVFIVLRRVLKCRKKGYGANFSFDKPRVNIGFVFWSNRIQDISKKLCVVKVKYHRFFFFFFAERIALVRLLCLDVYEAKIKE